MAGVAVASRRRLGIVAELLAHAGLGDALALLPVSQELAVGRVLDQRLLRLLERLRRLAGHDLFRDVFAAQALHVVLVDAVELGLPLS
ncbi:MAG: hypothetical protein IPL06_17665 [Betaproteobacteria bacterium]|nr:hypothetical protein [Betaproteobacteria bacterium]